MRCQEVKTHGATSYAFDKTGKVTEKGLLTAPML